MNVIKSISGVLTFVERTTIVLLLFVMLLLAFLQVILRNIFSTGMLWADPFLRHLVLWIGFIGASLATQQEKHINIDLVTRFVSPRVTNIARVLTNLFAGIICTLLSKAGWTFLESEQSVGDILLTIGAMKFPAWWFQLIIPLGFALMSFRFLLCAIEHSIEAFNPPKKMPPITNVPTIDI